MKFLPIPSSPPGDEFITGSGFNLFLVGFGCLGQRLPVYSMAGYYSNFQLLLRCLFHFFNAKKSVSNSGARQVVSSGLLGDRIQSLIYS